MSVPRLHPDTIDDVKQRADIVDVVSEHVVLRKQGKDFVGLCPFHDDKSPSFSVSPSKQFYYCFSCGAGGNAIKFLMELNKQSFGDVVLELARRYQVPLKTLEPEQRQELQRKLSLREQLYEILAVTAQFYQHALRQPQGEAALTYLIDKRQLQPETIQEFQLGHAPAGWQTLYGYLVDQKRYPVELVEKAGLIISRQGGGGYYDRFRDRLMIPIHDLQSRVIGFGGRSLGDEQPKYLNSPETELFDKGHTLYGLDKARGAIAKQDRAVVVEGYFDVIALHAAGITHAVASLGTALSLAQVKQLLRYTESKQIIYNFDADSAGIKATVRAIDELLIYLVKDDQSFTAARIKEKITGNKPASVQLTSVDLRVLNLPNSKDPDEFLQIHSASEYQTLIENAPPWIDWKIEMVLRGKDLNKADYFQHATREIIEILGNISNGVIRNFYIRQAADQLSSNRPHLALQIQESLQLQLRGQRWHGKSQKWQTPGDRTLLEESEAQLLRLYLHYSSARSQIQAALEVADIGFSISHHRFLWQQVRTLEQASPEPEAAATLLSRMQDRCLDHPDHLKQVMPLFQLNEKTRRDLLRAPLVIRTALACMERVMCEKRRRHFLDLWKQTDLTIDPAQCSYLQQQVYRENQRIDELDRLQRQITFADLAQVPWVGEFYQALEEPSS